MSKRIKVTGYFTIEDEEYDPGPNGPLTEEAFQLYNCDLDDERYELVEKNR
jgi:hypothetical protein